MARPKVDNFILSINAFLYNLDKNSALEESEVSGINIHLDHFYDLARYLIENDNVGMAEVDQLIALNAMFRKKVVKRSSEVKVKSKKLMGQMVQIEKKQTGIALALERLKHAKRPDNTSSQKAATKTGKQNKRSGMSRRVLLQGLLALSIGSAIFSSVPVSKVQAATNEQYEVENVQMLEMPYATTNKMEIRARAISQFGGHGQIFYLINGATDNGLWYQFGLQQLDGKFSVIYDAWDTNYHQDQGHIDLPSGIKEGSEYDLRLDITNGIVTMTVTDCGDAHNTANRIFKSGAKEFVPALVRNGSNYRIEPTSHGYTTGVMTEFNIDPNLHVGNTLPQRYEIISPRATTAGFVVQARVFTRDFSRNKMLFRTERVGDTTTPFHISDPQLQLNMIGSTRELVTQGFDPDSDVPPTFDGI